MTVPSGSTVRWTNYDGVTTHTSTSDTGIWDSGPLSSGQSFEATFNTPGTYPYHCTIHPNMTGTITVQLACTATPTLTPTFTPTLTPTLTHTPTPACPPVTRTVMMVNLQYQPQTITVTQGSTINWFNEGPYTHTTTSDAGIWGSGILNPGQSYQFTFNNPGTYPYHCTVHPGMTGTVTVAVCTPAATITPTITPTLTPTATPFLVGHVTWQGRPSQPSPLQQLPITLTLKTGTTEVNYARQNTDASGFFTVPLGGLANGTYSWRVKGPKFLANMGSVNLAGGSTSVEMGVMRTGDTNNDNAVNVADFNILKLTFGKTVGDPGYDARADFDGNDAVTVADFNLLKNNFGMGGASPIVPR